MNFTNTPDTKLKQQIDAEGVVILREEMKSYLEQDQFISASKLHTILVTSPKQFIYEWEHENDNVDEEETKSKRIGTAMHTLVLEADEFDKRYNCLLKSDLPFPNKDFRTKENKDYKENFIAQCTLDGMTMLTEDELEKVSGMGKSVKDNPTSSHILSQHGITELSIYTTYQWNERKYYVKIRPDFISLIKPFYLDLKSARSASPEKNGFPKDAYNYGYDVKIALYHTVLAQNWQAILDFCKVENKNGGLKQSLIVAVESTEPYNVAVYSIPEETMATGLYRMNMAMSRFGDCLESGMWPGYEYMAEEGSRGIIPLKLPSYSNSEIIM